jgi:hypothetical protein
MRADSDVTLLLMRSPIGSANLLSAASAEFDPSLLVAMMALTFFWLNLSICQKRLFPGPPRFA